MMDQKTVKEWLHNEEIIRRTQIEDLGSHLAKEFIAIYMALVEDEIDFDDFRTLIKLSVGFNNDAKLDFLTQKGADATQLTSINKQIGTYQEKVLTIARGDGHLTWRASTTSAVSKKALLALNINKRSITNNDALPVFLASLTHLIRQFLHHGHMDKQEARTLLLQESLSFPPYINSNTIANILYVLQPQAFPLTNNYVRDQIKSLLGLKVTNTTEGYIDLAKNLDEIAKNSGLSADYSMAIFDRLLAFYVEDYMDEGEINDNAVINETDMEKVAALGSLNTILFGAPGTGKTYHTREVAVKLADPDWYGSHQDDVDAIKQHYLALNSEQSMRIQFTTFHQSFAYEDFVEGIKAKMSPQNEVYYDIEDGIFKRMAHAALQDPKHNYVLIIDEINRGNVSRVLGELITLLEDDKRLGEDNELSIQLPYSKTSFVIPKNLYIVGTMNTADKSLAQLDLALRRRFDFVELMPNTSLLKDVQIYGHAIGKILETINKRIQSLLDREHVIGHAYFMPLISIDDEEECNALVQQIFKNKIIPLLQEYFFDDWDSIRKVLGLNSHLLITKEEAFEGLSSSPIYHIDHEALSNPEFYAGIKKAYEAPLR